MNVEIDAEGLNVTRASLQILIPAVIGGVVYEQYLDDSIPAKIFTFADFNPVPEFNNVASTTVRLDFSAFSELDGSTPTKIKYNWTVFNILIIHVLNRW